MITFSPLMILMYKYLRCNIFIATLLFFVGIIGKTVGQDVKTRLDNNFSEYNILKLDFTDAFRNTTRSENDVSLTIPSPYGEGTIELDLFRSNVISEDYSLMVSGEEGLVENYGSTVIPLRGLISDRPETRVNVVVDKNFFFACIDDGKDVYYYEPLSLHGGDPNGSDVVLYKDANVKPTASTCGSTALSREIDKSRIQDTYRAGECFEVEYAVASDYEMYQSFGNSVSSVEAFVISITDLMNTNYETDFDDELRHIVVQQVVSTSNNGDLWLTGGAPSAIDELLDEFTDWAPSGFSANHDIGSLWTGYDLSGNTVGIAWVGAVCTFVRYNVLEYFDNNMNSLRVLVAHEIGHNYNASHDDGTGFIMSPSLNNTNTWSDDSKNAINSFYQGIKDNCFDTFFTTSLNNISDFS